ncbi:hypothetical protein, partial [Collimonas sp.]|uniref:hypothetical protein n=1 Tax=Collimonas sp. TaxID=1963772 RepID=UPI0037C102E9
SLNSAVYICFGIFFIAGLSKGSLILRYLWKTKFRGKLSGDGALDGVRSNVSRYAFIYISLSLHETYHTILPNSRFATLFLFSHRWRKP